MTEPTLTVVIPAFNSEEHIAATIDALVEAATRSPFVTDVVIVDDGSTDGTAAAAVSACAERLPLRVVSQENRGRFEARRAGLEAATGEWVLLLDSRVTLEPGSLSFVAGRLESDRIWTGHVVIDPGSNMFVAFWRLIGELAWTEYLDEPRTTSFGLEDFDRYPKGTTCFLAQRSVLLDAFAAFESRYSDLRMANDDTPLIRGLAGRERIHISPQFACAYVARSSAGSFVRHSIHRGVVFLDGHGRTESRFFPAAVAFYPVSAAVAVAVLRRPVLAPLVAVGVGVAAASLGVVRSRTAFEIATLGLVTPIYAACHGFGMWKGLAAVVRKRAATL